MNRLLCKKTNELSKKKKKGFTLVELIIVIAIIAILAAIAIPKFGEIRNSANVKSDISTAKNIATVVAAGIADNKIKDSQAGNALNALDSPNASGDVDITLKIDGGVKPKVTGKTAFYVTVTSGNIVVSYDTAGTDKVYPAS